MNQFQMLLRQNQGWTLALARSPRRVSKVSGECKSQITRPFGECDFSSPRNKLNCKINDVFYILFCREISKHKLTIVHICMAKFYTPNCLRWREKERKKPESCLWFKGLKGVREEQIEEVFSEMASWPAMVAAWSVVHRKQSNFNGTECL